MKRQSAKDRILQVFEIIIKKKDLSKITVEEVIELAGVSKTTFYRYYKDKYDLACKYIAHIIKPYNDQYLENRDFRQFALVVSSLFRDNKHLFKLLYTDPYEQNSVYQYYVNYGIAYLEKYIDKSIYNEEMKLELHKCIHGNLAAARDIITGNLQVDFDMGINYLLNEMPEFIRKIIQI